MVRITPCLAALAVLAAATPLFATDYTSSWAGASGTPWTDPAQWVNTPPAAVYPDNTGGDTFQVDILAGNPVLQSSVAISTLTLGGTGSLNLGTAGTPGTLAVSGLTTWNAGTINGAGTLNANGGLALTGPVTLDSAQLNAAAASTWSGTGNVLLANNATLAASGSFQISGDAALNGGAAGQFTNAGNLVKSAGTGTTALNVPFHNTGTVEAASGTLAINAGGTSSGLFNATGGRIDINSSYTLNTGATFTGTGLDIGLGTTGFVHLNGGTLTVNGTATTTTRFQMNAGGMAGPGAFVNTGKLNIAGNADKSFSTLTLENDGTMEWVDGNLQASNGFKFQNDGTLNIVSSNRAFNNAGGTQPIFENNGIVNKISVSSTAIYARFNTAPSSSVNITSGTFALHGGGTLAGGINLYGGTFRIDNGNYTLAGALIQNFIGTSRLVNGNLTAQAGTSSLLSNMSLENGTVSVPAGATLALSGTVNQTGGTLSAAGTLNTSGAVTLGGTQLIYNVANLAILNGSVALAPNGNRVLAVDNLTATGKLDIHNNALVWQSASPDTVKAALVLGRNDGAWNGTAGITSTTAQNDPDTTLGYRLVNAPETFRGVNLVAGDVVVIPTFPADANLDGKVNVGDLGVLASNWNGSGKHWYEADFDYNGVINVGDLGVLASSWNMGVTSTSLSFAEALALFPALQRIDVPEPASLALLAIGAAAMLRRKR